MSLNRIATKQQVITRLTQGTDELIPSTAQFVRTDNGYWVAWHDGIAIVLHEDARADEVSFRVEGAASLSELVDMLTNGDFDEIEEFSGTDEEWLASVPDSDDHHHNDDGPDCQHSQQP